MLAGRRPAITLARTYQGYQQHVEHQKAKTLDLGRREKWSGVSAIGIDLVPCPPLFGFGLKAQLGRHLNWLRPKIGNNCDIGIRPRWDWGRIPAPCPFLSRRRVRLGLLRGAMQDVTAAWIMPVLLGPFIGSFLGVLVLRLPSGEGVIFGRSACRRCGRRLGVGDLAPLLSWVLSRGHCRHCDEKIGLFYPLIELAALGIAVWSATILSGWLLWATCLLGWTLLALAAMDWRAFVLPDMLTLPLVPAGLIVAYMIAPVLLADHLIGALAGYLAFAGLAAVYRYLRGRDGLGMGDAKLLAGGGAWVSWSGLPSVVLLAAALAFTVILAKSLAGGPVSATDRIPFGSYLALGIWLVWLYGPVSL